MNIHLRRLNPTATGGQSDPMRNAEHVAEMLKLMAHPHRLMILCLLAESERNVTELVEAIGVNQTAVSNHLSKLRSAGIIDYTRYHRVLQYRLCSPEARTVLDVVGGLCLNRCPHAEAKNAAATPAE